MTTRTLPPLRSVFIDTGAYYALADPRDRNHSAADRIVNRLAHERPRFYTTNFILAETHALLLSRLGRHQAWRFLQRIDQETDGGNLTLVRVTREDEARAREIIDRYQDKAFSYADATCFAVIERLRIQAAFTFDGNFTQYGLRVLAP